MDASLAGYLARIQELEFLGREEELALARRWREHGDRSARDQLVKAHLRLVLPIVRRYQRPGASLPELIAEGNLGLLHASQKFEPNRSLRFATYAKYWVRAFAAEYAIGNSGTVFRQPRRLRKVRRAYKRACNTVGEGVEARRIASELLRMGSGEFDDLLALSEHGRVPLEAMTERPSPAGAYNLCLGEQTPEQRLLATQERSSLVMAVRNALAGLDTRERRIVDQRLMADADATLTLKELGNEFGISRERVRQIEARLKRKLATSLAQCSEQNAEWAEC